MTGFNVSDPEEVLTTLLNAFELDGPVLVNIMTDPNALAMPPKIEFGQMVGFAQSMYKLLINGRSQEVIDTINSNFNIYRRYFKLFYFEYFHNLSQGMTYYYCQF